MITGRRILITGATGFLGRALCAAAVERGADVHGVARRLPEDPVAGVHYEAIDLVDEPAVASLLHRVRPDVVLHLASEVSGARAVGHVAPMLRVNLVGAVNVLLAAQASTRPRVVMAGSMEEPDLGDADAVPQSPYAAAKWAALAYARMFGALYALPVVHLRVFMVYGPGQRDTGKLVPYVIRALLDGTAPQLMSGAREIDWVFVEDVAEAFLLAAVADGIDGRSYDVGSGRLVTVRSLVAELADVLGTDVEPVFGAVPDRALERVRVAQIAATASELGWTPRVPLRVGLERTVDFYRRGASG
jgi:nucleoside-diphosphate-sugar epimerase